MTSPNPAPDGIRQHRFETPPDATTILLVRHGESWPSHPDRPFPLKGGHGDPPLAPEGHEQARQLAERLAEQDIGAIYVTPLQRTHQTAEPLARRLGITPIEVADLREVFLGEWEGGLFRTKAVDGDPIFRRIFEEERWDVIPGGEPLDAFDTRIRRGLAHLVDAHRGERIVAVAHGGVIGHILHTITQSRRFAFAGADNASITELVALEHGVVLRSFNDTSHLS